MPNPPSKESYNILIYAPQTSEIDWAKGQQEEHAEL